MVSIPRVMAVAAMLCAIGSLPLAAQLADTALFKTVEPGPATDLFRYVLTMTNNGPDEATGITNRDLVPVSLRYVGHSNGDFIATSGVWRVDALAAGASTTLVIDVRMLTPFAPMQWFYPPTNPAIGKFGTPLALLDANTLVAGSSLGSGSTSGAPVCLFARDGTLLRSIHGPAGWDVDAFGSAVAALGSDRIVVGAMGADHGGLDAGAVFLLDTNGVLLAGLTNPAPAIGDFFGVAVAALGHDRIIVGARGKDAGSTDAGTAYLYDTNGVLLATLTNPAPTLRGAFGSAVASLGEDRVIIGAPQQAVGIYSAGAVHVLSTNGSLLVTITNPTPTASDNFGISVAELAGDRIIVGAYLDTGGGAAYLYSSSGALLTVLSNPAPAVVDHFGYSVAAMGPDRILVGAPLDDVATNDTGAAYVFDTNGVLLAMIQAPYATAAGSLGASVAAWNAQEAVVSAGSSLAGLPHIVLFDATAAGRWIENTVLRLAQTGTDTAPGNDSATVRMLAGVSGDVAITFSQSLAQAIQNQVNLYTIVASNAGNVVMSGLQIRQVLPSGLVFGSAQVSTGFLSTVPFSTGIVTSTARTWSLDRLNPGEVQHMLVRATVATNSAVLTSLVRLVASAQADSEPANDTASAVLTVYPYASQRTLRTLSIWTPLGSTVPEAGDYTFEAGSDVSVVVVPDGITNHPVVRSPTSWSATGFLSSVSGTGSVANIVVTNDDRLIWKWGTSRVFMADTGLSKISDADAPSPGTIVTYAITLTNAGPDAATDITNRELLPSGLQFISASSGHFQPTNGLWRVLRLDAGAVTTLQITARVLLPGVVSAIFRDPPPCGTDSMGVSLCSVGTEYVAVGATTDSLGGNQSGTVSLFDLQGGLRIAIPNPTPAAGDGFGEAVAMLGEDRIVIAASQDDVAATNGGAVHLFDLNGQLLRTFTATEPMPNHRFGCAVASAGNNRIAIGACGDDLWGIANAGAVFIVDTNGVVQVVLENPVPAVNEYFGYRVEGVGQGRLAVAAPGDAGGGAVYVYADNGDLLVTITNPTPALWDSFGSAMTRIGSNRLLIAAPYDDAGFTDAGSAYLFDLSGTLLLTITNPAPATADLFGSSVAAAGSDRIAIGASQDDAGGTNSGTVYVFDTNGVLLAELLSPSPSANEYFGSAVIALDRDRLVVGVPQDDLAAANSGAAYAFDLGSGGHRLDNRVERLSQAEPDPLVSNNAANRSIWVGASGDVAVTLSAHLAEVMPAQTNYYEVTVSNAGATVMTMVRLRCDWAVWQTFLATNWSAGAYDTLANEWCVARLEPGQSESLVLSALFSGSAAYYTSNQLLTNRVRIFATGQADLQESNDVAYAVVRGLTNAAQRTFGMLTIRSDYGASVPMAGDYNVASGTIQTISVGPSGITNTVSVVNPYGWCFDDGREPAWGFGTQATITVGGHATFTWLWTTSRTVIADTALAKTAGTSAPLPGSSVHYILSMTNRGPDDAAGITNRDVLPLGLRYVSHSNGRYDAESGLWSVGALAAGASTTLHVEAQALVAGGPYRFLHPVPSSGVFFGQAVAALGTDRVIVGASAESVGGTKAGGVYLFDTNGTLLLRIAHPFPMGGSCFGSAVAALGTDRIIVGAYLDDLGATNAGRAYLFDTSGTLLATLTNPTPRLQDEFGQCVAGLGTDRIVVGEHRDYSPIQTAGSVHVFDTNGQMLVSIANPDPSVDDGFGYAVATLGSDRIVVGCYRDDTNGYNAGSVYVFDGSGTLVARIFNPMPASNDEFGSSVATVGTNLVLVGSALDDAGAMNAGAAYLFNDQGQLLLTITNPAPAMNDNFGMAVTGLGTNLLAVGASRDDGDAPDTGIVYVFDLGGTLLRVLPNPSPASGDCFGFSIAAVGGDRLVVGACSDDSGATDAGSAYLFDPIRGGARIENRISRTAQTEMDPEPANDVSVAFIWTGSSGDIAVAQSQSLAEAVPNQTNRYTIVVSNAGATVMSGLRVADILPGGMVIVGTNLSVGLFDGAAGIWEIPALAPGQVAQMVLAVRFGAALGVLTNRAFFQGGDLADSDPANDEAATAVTVLANAAFRTIPMLQVRSSFGSPAPVAGDYTYPSGTVVALSAGPEFVTNYPFVYRAAGWSLQGNEPASGTGSMFIATLTNHATLTWLWETSSFFTAAVGVYKTVDVSHPSAGAAVNYTITVTNQGPLAATGLAVRDALPDVLRYVSHSNGSYVAASGVWQIGQLAAGASTSLLLGARTVRTPGVAAFLHEAPPSAYARFGWSVSSWGGDRFLVGSPYAIVGNQRQGQVSIFDAQGTLTGILGNPVLTTGDGFGYAVAPLGSDRVIVGAPWARPYGSARTGAAYVLDAAGHFLVRLASPTLVEYDYFGTTVAALGTTRILVGAQMSQWSGTVFMFDTNGTPLATITNPTPAAGDYFGQAISVFDENRFLVTAPEDDAAAANSGVVHLFDGSGALLATITNPTPSVGDCFGSAVALVGSNAIVVGAYKDDASAPDAGVVHVFDRNGTWTGTIPNPEPVANAKFGWSVAAVGTNRILVGAIGVGPEADHVGRAYVLDLAGNLSAVLQNPSPAVQDCFGMAVAGLESGQALVGVSYDEAGGSHSGSAYLFDVDSFGIRIDNTAAKSALDQFDPVATDDVATASLWIGASGDVAVALSQSGAAIHPGQTNVYTIIASNAGTTVVTGVRIQEMLPAGLLCLATNPSTGYFDGSVHVWEIDRLQPGEFHTLAMVARAIVSNAVLTNTVRFLTAAQADVNTTNDTAVSVLTILDQRMVTVAVVSAHGIATPGLGTFLAEMGSTITNGIAVSAPVGQSHYRCTGWTLSGHEPVSGTNLSCVIVVTNSTTLTWHWVTNHWLAVSAGPHGAVDGPGGWLRAGHAAHLVALPEMYYGFASWSGDIAVGEIQANPLDVIMNQPTSLAASFTPLVTTNTGTPYWWLARHGLTGSFEALALLDPNGNGYSTADDYILGLDPTNPASIARFEIRPMGSAGQGVLLTWPSVSGRVYAVECLPDPVRDNWVPLPGFTNIVATPPLNSITNHQSFETNGWLFFRHKTRIAP